MLGQLELGPSSSYPWCYKRVLTLSQMENSRGQSPCVVAAKLVASVTCYNDDYTLLPLGVDGWYKNGGGNPPACMCNDEICLFFHSCSAFG
jgi:hypothetical protein